MWEREHDDEFDDLDDDELGEDDRSSSSPAVSIEISGLSLYTHHGVSEAERELGQRLVFDISFELDECDATVTDRIEDTIDYGEVCEQVALAAQERSYKTLERLCAGGRRPARRPLRRGVRARQGDQARAADPVAGRRGLRRGVEGSLRTGYLGLGSNVGDREANLRDARAALGRAGVEVLASSSLYETAPQGELLDQPDFLNACLRIRTALEPEELLDVCKGVERELGPRARRAFATGRGRSTSICCCSATSSTARSASPCPTARSRAGASWSSRCWSSTRS